MVEESGSPLPMTMTEVSTDSYIDTSELANMKIIVIIIFNICFIMIVYCKIKYHQ